MNIEDYMVSPEFLVFLDEVLRQEAIRAAERIFRETEVDKRRQLHVIPSIIQGAGLGGLRELAEKQKSKSSNQKNRDFWAKIAMLLSKTDTSDESLFVFLKSMLLEIGIIENEGTTEDRKTQKQVRKRNNIITDGFLERIIGVYFEHFTCHYYYQSHQGV